LKVPAAPSGVRATATLTLDASSDGSEYHPADGDLFYCAAPIFVRQTLTASPNTYEVYRGASYDEFIDNFVALIDNTGIRGVNYEFPNWYANYNIQDIFEISAEGDAWCTVRVKRYGSTGNKYMAWLYSGSWTDCTFGTGNRFTGGQKTSGTTPGAGTYNFRYGYHRSADGATSGASPTAEVSQDEAMNIDLSVITDPLSDDDIDYKRTWRTAAGGSILYRDEDILEVSTSVSSDNSDTVLTTHATYDPTINRTYEGGFIERVRYCAEYKGRWFGGGFVLGSDVTDGTCTVQVQRGEPKHSVEIYFECENVDTNTSSGGVPVPITVRNGRMLIENCPGM
jgi:hypothetical protein